MAGVSEIRPRCRAGNVINVRDERPPAPVLPAQFLARADLAPVPARAWSGLRFGDHKRLEGPGAVAVFSAGAAVARRRARHRGEVSAPALVERRGAGHLDGGAPGAVGLADHERLEGAGAG